MNRNERTMPRRLVLTVLVLLVAAVLPGCAVFGGEESSGRTKLTISYQDTAFPALIEESGVLDGADFDVEWVNLSGPAANLQALYSGAIDLGHMGDTSLTIEQANSDTEWTQDNAPLEIVAGWRSPASQDFAPLVTAARTSSGVTDIEDARGKKWAFNFGGYNHAQYLVSLVQAGLTEDDVEGTQFADGATSAAAFNSGEVDVYSGGQAPIRSTIEAGDATILLRDTDTEIPALNVWTASRDVLADDAKDEALADFFERMSGYWTWHDENPDAVKAILKKQLKVDDARADFEYEVRRGVFQAFDDGLIEDEQAVAQSMYDGGAIDELPEVGIGFDPRYNDAQQAVPDASAPAPASDS